MFDSIAELDEHGHLPALMVHVDLALEFTRWFYEERYEIMCDHYLRPTLYAQLMDMYFNLLAALAECDEPTD